MRIDMIESSYKQARRAFIALFPKVQDSVTDVISWIRGGRTLGALLNSMIILSHPSFQSVLLVLMWRQTKISEEQQTGIPHPRISRVDIVSMFLNVPTPSIICPVNLSKTTCLRLCTSRCRRHGSRCRRCSSRCRRGSHYCCTLASVSPCITPILRRFWFIRRRPAPQVEGPNLWYMNAL